MTCTFNGHFSVAVEVWVTLAQPHQATVKRRRPSSSTLLSREKVREASAGKAVDVVDGIAVPGKGVEEHLCPTGDAHIGNLQQGLWMEASTAHSWHLTSVRAGGCVSDTNVKNLERIFFQH